MAFFGNPLEGEPSDNLYVTGLPIEFDTDAINQFFSACGNVLQAKGLGYGNAMVRFGSIEEAQTVKDTMHGQQPMGCPKPLHVAFAVSGGGKGKGGCAMGGGGKGGKQGDWACPACGDLQFARNDTCRMCGSPKEAAPSAWGPAAGGWGGAKAADSWGGAAPAPYIKKVASKGKGKGDGTEMSACIDGLIAEGLPGGGFDYDTNALYVTNLPFDCTEKDLYKIFATFGAIPPRGTKIMPGTPGQRLYAFVNFMDQTAAEFAAMAMNDVTQPDGCKLVVKMKQKRGEGGLGKGAGAAAAAAANWGGAPVGVVDPQMMQRLKAKLAEGPQSAYEISQWYIIEFLAHITDESEMKAVCDSLLAACGQLGLA